MMLTQLALSNGKKSNLDWEEFAGKKIRISNLYISCPLIFAYDTHWQCHIQC
jgi:hypothetical protein